VSYLRQNGIKRQEEEGEKEGLSGTPMALMAL
jgi:hypothetical protein